MENCKTCTLEHAPQDPAQPFDLDKCLSNALGEIGHLQSRIRELKRDKAELYSDIDTLELQVSELENKIKQLTREVD